VTVTAPSSFKDTLAAVRDVPGWLTDDQARRLFEAARALPAGATIVEIGSYVGRSTIVLARAAPPEVEIVAIDPHAGNDRAPRQIHGTAAEGQRDHDAFLANLERAGVRESVRHLRRFSQDALEGGPPRADLLYVDGAHRYRPARDDIAHWGARVPPGGALLIHDSFSAVGVTLAQVRVLLFSGRFRFVRRTGTLSEYRREDLRGGRRVRNALRQLTQLPYFARNLVVKLALAARLRSGEWPY
jgi:predicted O-methyltransferase YrrM